MIFLQASWRSLTKRAGSGYGSVPKCHGPGTMEVRIWLTSTQHRTVNSPLHKPCLSVQDITKVKLKNHRHSNMLLYTGGNSRILIQSRHFLGVLWQTVYRQKWLVCSFKKTVSKSSSSNCFLKSSRQKCGWSVRSFSIVSEVTASLNQIQPFTVLEAKIKRHE